MRHTSVNFGDERGGPVRTSALGWQTIIELPSLVCGTNSSTLEAKDADLGAAKAENRGVVATEAGSYLRLIDCCITQLKAQRPSRTCNESKEEEEEDLGERKLWVG